MRTTVAREIAGDIHERITTLTERGNRKSDRKQYAEAIADFEQALALIPEPVEEWEASTWILIALGDCHFLQGNFAAALEPLERALVCPDVEGTEFLALRLGQVLFELGQKEEARAALTDAWELGGPELFEDEDPKYRQLLQS
jgi:tetratricopeptide (TPR) repeat protein